MYMKFSNFHLQNKNNIEKENKPTLDVIKEEKENVPLSRKTMINITDANAITKGYVKKNKIKEEISKEEILLNELSQYGYTEDNLISQNELALFLDRKSTKNKFDIVLLEKLFSLLNLTEYDTVTISQFVSGFIKMEEEFRKSREELNEEYLNKKKEYENILDMCKRYQSEKLNEEGFSEKCI